MITLRACLIVSILVLVSSFHLGDRRSSLLMAFGSKSLKPMRSWNHVLYSSKDRSEMQNIDIVAPAESRSVLLSKVEEAVSSGSSESVVSALEDLSQLPFTYNDYDAFDIFSYLNPGIMRSMTPNLAVRVVYLFAPFLSRCNLPHQKDACKQLFNVVFSPNQPYPFGMLKTLICRFAYTKMKIAEMDPLCVRNMYDNLRQYVPILSTGLMSSLLHFLDRFGLESGAMPSDVQQVFLATVAKQAPKCNLTTTTEVVARLGTLGVNMTKFAEHKVALHDVANKLLLRCEGRKRKQRKALKSNSTRSGECLDTLKGLCLMGLTYDSAAPRLKVTLRKLLSRFPYRITSLGSVLYWLGRLGLHWDLFNTADQRKIESEVIAALKGANAVSAARMVHGLGGLLRLQRRVSATLKSEVEQSLLACMDDIQGSYALLVIEGLANLKCPLTSLSEQFQLGFQSVLDTELRQGNEVYAVELSRLLDKWRVDRTQLLPELQKLLSELSGDSV